MKNFETFSLAVHQQYLKLAKGELFEVAIEGDVFWAAYLAAFPEGTDPLYITNTEHNCSCCRNFIKNLGLVVAIDGDKVSSVWATAEALPYPYDVVAAALDKLISKAPIKGLFRSSEPSYGVIQNKQQLADGTVKTWKHFHGKVGAKHFTKEVGTQVGAYTAAMQVFRRGLEELTTGALQQVQELIDTNALYRGEEHKAALNAFTKLHDEYADIDNVRGRELFVVGKAFTEGARFRHTVIGTLVQDLSEGKGIEYAVKAFEIKVAPTNYKRPTALITQLMVNAATKTIADLGIEDALSRRLAIMADVSINDVLWAARPTQAKMKGGIAGLLSDAVVTKTTASKSAVEIGIEDFMKTVLPTATSVEVLFQNAHLGNLVTLTAPVHEGEPVLFKWPNDFAWSYAGNVADSDMQKAVVERGGSVSGVFRFTHSWNHHGRRNASLMDLHVFMPGSSIRPGATTSAKFDYGNGRRVGWNRRSDGASGGVQDVDYTSPAPDGYIPVENITFPHLNTMPDGDYLCKIHNWSERAPNDGGFKAEIAFGGQVFTYDHPKPVKHGEWVDLATVTLKAGQFTITHHHPVGDHATPAWGITTGQFVPVETIMLSPNYWHDSAVGNKHWIFALAGCKTAEPMRGIYNEFLSSDLDKHRKVFEVLGSKTKCPVTDEQISGLGFSSTKPTAVTVKVDSRQYIINF